MKKVLLLLTTLVLMWAIPAAPQAAAPELTTQSIAQKTPTNHETVIYAIDPQKFDPPQAPEPTPATPTIYTAGISLPKDLDYSNIFNIILSILAVVASGVLVFLKKKGREIENALKTLLDALEDNKLTAAELKAIAAAIRKIFNKAAG